MIYILGVCLWNQCLCLHMIPEAVSKIRTFVGTHINALERTRKRVERNDVHTAMYKRI